MTKAITLLPEIPIQAAPQMTLISYTGYIIR